jgi:L-serine dehydratase
LLKEAIQQAEAMGVSLSTVFLANEAKEKGWSTDAVRLEMEKRVDVMREALNRGLNEPQQSLDGLIHGGAAAVLQWGEKSGGLLGKEFNRIIASALAVAEVNACRGRVVAAPTAGSCGVLPAVIITYVERDGLARERLVDAFLTAGGIGLAIQEQATLSGAEGGCQAEVGSASAMAAGALVEIAGGKPNQVGHAVAFALKNLLGLICDPVLGRVEVPCVKRNALGAANAVASAEMALAGLESIFPVDDVIHIMGEVGRKLPTEFRETARGGLASLSCSYKA